MGSIAHCILKPDALSGPASVISGKTAARLVECFRTFLDPERGGNHIDARGAAAARQIQERAETEASFRGGVVAPALASAELTALVARCAMKRRLVLSELLLDMLKAAGFDILTTTTLTLSEADVSGIYGSTDLVDEQIHKQLMQYLVDQPVLIVTLDCSRQSSCVLEWWKTFVRHLLLGGPTRAGWRLRNLVHVCASLDSDYICKRLDDVVSDP